MQPVDLRRVRPKATITEKQCTACRHKEYVPQPGHIPESLRNLKPSIIQALRPLDIDTGVYERAQH
eukprot:2442503-Karenia_brevis.AAC.1